MRDKKWFVRADWILWTFISILPLLAYLFTLLNGNEHSGTFASTFMSDFGSAISGNPIASTLTSIFGANGVFPILNSNANNRFLVYFFSYFMTVNICHIFVDFILFIPRLAHKFMDGFLGGD